MTRYKMNHPDCQVWRASPKLQALLPPEAVAPFKLGQYGGQDIDITDEHGIKWLYARDVEWHTDWYEVFRYVVVRGIGTLHIAKECDAHEESPKAFHSLVHCRIERGDVIQMWPMRYHQVTSIRRNLSMIALDGGPVDGDRRHQDDAYAAVRARAKFFTPRTVERYLINDILGNYHAPVPVSGEARQSA